MILPCFKLDMYIPYPLKNMHIDTHMFPNTPKRYSMVLPDMDSIDMYPGCMCILSGKANRWCVSMSRMATPLTIFVCSFVKTNIPCDNVIFMERLLVRFQTTFYSSTLKEFFSFFCGIFLIVSTYILHKNFTSPFM